MAIRSFIGAAAIILIAACSSTPDGSKSGVNASGKLGDRLAPRDLSNGECGIFVWTADAARRFVFFSQATTPAANWWSHTGEQTIMRTSSDGLTAFEQSPVQSFALSDGGSLKLALSDPEEVDNGTRYKSGAITQTGPDGWERVMPVFGVAACNVRPIGAQYSMRSTRSNIRVPKMVQMGFDSASE